MPSRELKHHVILVINIILRENWGKVFLRTWNATASKIHSAKVERCRAWVNKFSSYDEQTCDHAIIFFKPRRETNGPWSDTKFKPFGRTSGINSSFLWRLPANDCHLDGSWVWESSAVITEISTTSIVLTFLSSHVTLFCTYGEWKIFEIKLNNCSNSSNKVSKPLQNTCTVSSAYILLSCFSKA